MNTLITGGAGCIGSHTVRALAQGGRDIAVLHSVELGRVDAVIDVPLVVGDATSRPVTILDGDSTDSCEMNTEHHTRSAEG